MTDSTDTAPARQTRKGGCHCGAFAYELETPEIKEVSECNCSLCSKKGSLYKFIGEDDKFTVVKGDESALSSYTFGPGNIVHKFCPTCGVGIMATMKSAPPGKQNVLNIHTIADIDSWSLTRHPFDGAALGTAYEPPAHRGALPEAKEGEKVYTGSCHCGALTVAVASKPLDETYTDRVVECNCSICERLAAVWIYPARDHVVLSVDDEAHRGEYTFNLRVGQKTFCRVCGVALTNNTRRFSEEELAALPESFRGFIGSAYTRHPVNVRALHGVDVSKLKVEHEDGRNR